MPRVTPEEEREFLIGGPGWEGRMAAKAQERREADLLSDDAQVVRYDDDGHPIEDTEDGQDGTMMVLLSGFEWGTEAALHQEGSPHG